MWDGTYTPHAPPAGPALWQHPGMFWHLAMDAADAAGRLEAAVTQAAREAVAARGRFTLALTGGSAATALYPALVAAPLPWGRVHVFFGDERCVPPDHAESNHRLAQEVLLSKVPIPAENIHRIHGEDAPDAAAQAYQQVLLAQTGDGALDMVHLGLGPDGHVCSLFPGHALLTEKTRLVAALQDAPKPPPARVTLTLPALGRARALWFLVLGASKADAVGKTVTAAAPLLPAAQAARCGAPVHWLVDAAAAALVPGTL